MTESTPPPRKPRRWLRRLGILLVLLLILAWFAPTILVRTGVLNPTIARATASINGHVGIGSISLGWFSPVVLTDVTLSDFAGKPILSAPKVTLSRSLLDLARDRSDLGTLTIENPKVDLVFANGTTNLETAIEKLLNDPTPASGPRPALIVKVTHGTLTARDADRSWSAHELDVTATIPTTDPIRIQATGTLEQNGSLSADVSVGNGFAAKVKTTGFPLELSAPFVRRFEPDLQLAGRLTADLTARLDLGTTTTLSVAGAVAIADFEARSHRFGTEKLILKAVELPCIIESTPTVVKIEKAELTCDLGTASFAGTFDPNEPLERWIDRAGLTANADFDVARLAAMMPKLLRMREGTELTEGRITAKLASQSGANGTSWTGTLGTSSLRGRRNGQPLAWEKPLTVSFTGRLGADRLPVFERLDAAAEFATLNAAGAMDNFTLSADVSLDRLTARLGEFVDLTGLQLAGTTNLKVTGRTANGLTTIDGTARVRNLAYARGASRYQEPDLTAVIALGGTFLQENGRRINTATLTVTAGSESAEFKLLEPIDNIAAPDSGKAVAKLTGDLAKWSTRASSFVSMPNSFTTIGGNGTLGGTVTVTPAIIKLDGVTADLKNARFEGYGIRLDEPQLYIDPTTGSIDRQSGLIDFPTVMLRSSTVAAAVKPFRLVPIGGSEYGVELDATANANLARVQQLLKLQADPTLSDRIDGIVASGTVSVRTAGTTYTFDASLPVQKFVFGHPQKPTWSEEKLTILAKGGYDVAADQLKFDRAIVERPDGLKMDALGRIDKITTVTDFDLNGKLSYDLAIVEPQLKKLLGNSFQAKGKDTRDFRIAGQLASVGSGHPSLVSRKDTTPLGNLNGHASLGWQSLKAYGFDVGQSQVVAKIDRGLIDFDPIEATFGQTGKVRMKPQVAFLPKGSELSLMKGKLIDQAKLTPAACADALGYVLPAFARSTETSGTISFEIDENRIPLADPEKATMSGRLTLHEVQVGPGPVIAEIAQLAGAKNSTFSLNRDNKPQTVNVKLENGWVYHDNLVLATKNFMMTTSGRVSLAGDLEMTADLPLPDSDIGPLLKNNPKIREALAKKRIQLPVRGTIHKPKLDPGAFRAAVRKVTDEIVRDLGKNALGGLLDKIGPPPKK